MYGNQNWPPQGTLPPNNQWGQPKMNPRWGQPVNNGWGNPNVNGYPPQPNNGWGAPMNNGWGQSINNGWVQPQSNGWNQPNQVVKTEGKFNPNTDYYIVSAMSSNILLDISRSKGNKAVIKKKSSKSQKFRIKQVFNKFMIVCSDTGEVLAIPSMSQANGEDVIAVPPGTSSS